MYTLNIVIIYIHQLQRQENEFGLVMHCTLCGHLDMFHHFHANLNLVSVNVVSENNSCKTRIIMSLQSVRTG